MDELTTTRRNFIGAATAASYSRVMGANERIRIGFIGCGLIGLRHIADFKKQPDADLAAVCDVYQPRVERGQADCGSKPKGYADFRKMLDDKGVDAVIISTPDHWHALQTIMACAAGKDVYVEKPMTLFVKEGRWMTTAARRYKRVVQTGTQGRSGPHFKEALPMLRGGHIGKIHSVRIGSFRNIMPGFGRPKDSDPPSGLDYDMWLGPAPKTAYTLHRSLYHFRWFWDYSGGQMTNLGAHDLDFVHYVLPVKGPTSVFSSGGRFALEDDGETPDTQDAIFDYPGFTVVISIREASGGRRPSGGTEFFGTKGSMTVGRGGYEVFARHAAPPNGRSRHGRIPRDIPKPPIFSPSRGPRQRKAATPRPSPWIITRAIGSIASSRVNCRWRTWKTAIAFRWPAIWPTSRCGWAADSLGPGEGGRHRRQGGFRPTRPAVSQAVG